MNCTITNKRRRKRFPKTYNIPIARASVSKEQEENWEVQYYITILTSAIRKHGPLLEEDHLGMFDEYSSAGPVAEPYIFDFNL